MIIKVKKGSDYAFIDNEGEVQGKVEVSGNGGLSTSINRILNFQTAIRFKGELDGIPSDLVIREGTKPAEIYKASDKYLKEYFIKDLESQGFEVTIIG